MKTPKVLRYLVEYSVILSFINKYTKLRLYFKYSLFLPNIKQIDKTKLNMSQK